MPMPTQLFDLKPLGVRKLWNADHSYHFGFAVPFRLTVHSFRPFILAFGPRFAMVYYKSTCIVK